MSHKNGMLYFNYIMENNYSPEQTLDHSIKTPEKTPQSEIETFGKKTYDVEGKRISVAWKKYVPEAKSGEIIDPKKATFFIPGWSYTENASSLERMGREFAEHSRGNTYMIDTTTESIAEGNLNDEAKAIALFLNETEIDNLTGVGNSQGAGELIHLIAQLQEQRPDIKIEGLGLFDPVTIREQPRRKFVINYAKDLIKTGLALARVPKMGEDSHVYSQNAKYIKDGVTGILKSVLHAKVAGWPAKVWNEVTEMTKLNPDLAKIKCPVVIVQGENDGISDPKFTAPKNPDNPSEGYIDDLQTREARLKALENNQEASPESTTREEYLKKTLFPQSPYVRLIVPSKMGVHNVTFSRPDVASATLYLLKRYHRGQETAQVPISQTQQTPR